MGVVVDISITLPKSSWLPSRKGGRSIIGPFAVDNYICITDRVGFGAMHQSLCDLAIKKAITETSDHNVREARKIVRHTHGKTSVDCQDLIKWLNKFADFEQNRYVMVYGCFLDSSILLRWLERSPGAHSTTKCTVARHRYLSGHFLVFIGDKWRISVAGCARNGTEKDCPRWPDQKLLQASKA